MDLATIIAIIAAFAATAQKMQEENRDQTTEEEQASLDNVLGRRATEEARFQEGLSDTAAGGSGNA